jgi:hypothetical protein
VWAALKRWVAEIGTSFSFGNFINLEISSKLLQFLSPFEFRNEGWHIGGQCCGKADPQTPNSTFEKQLPCGL